MKTNDYVLATATAAFSYLFYKQNAGINFLVFNLLFLIITVLRDNSLLKGRKWWWGAVMCLVSSIGIVVHSSDLAVFSNCLSLILVSGFSFKRQTSAAFSFLFSCYSLVIAAAYIIDGWMRPNPEKERNKSGTIYKVVGLVAVLLLSAMFLGLYRLSNPLFAANTSWINLEFISLSWVAFTAFGFLIVYGLYYQRTLAPVEVWENSLPLSNIKEADSGSVKLETERVAGIILFGLLNLMLITLNLGDISTLWFGHALPEGISHSDFVHHGVATTIFSIIIATGLIMFLFRRDFVSQKNNGYIKSLVCLWILQTFVMLISTAIRNQLYIQEFSLTENRIGVYVWLMLSVIGLALTTDKILKERSNWFLIKNNVSVWFTILAISALFNWDLIITRYNLASHSAKNVDYEYLFALSDANIPELIEVTRKPEFAEINKMEFGTNGHNYNYYLHQKIKNYLVNYTNDWQSWDLRDKRNSESILKQ